jgi:hypothetical protein
MRREAAPAQKELYQGGSGVDQRNQELRRRGSFNPFMLYGVSTICDRGYQRQGGEVMFIEVSGMVGPREGNRGGVKTPAGKCLINILEYGSPSLALGGRHISSVDYWDAQKLLLGWETDC